MNSYINKIILLICAFWIGLANASYAQKYYLPDEGELLMISQPGDFKISSVFPGEGIYTAQIGYSPMKHISVVGSFMHDKSTNQNYGIFGPYEQSSRGFNANGAVGAYYFLGSKKKAPPHFFLSQNVTLEQGVLFDAYAGYSFGKVHNFYDRSAESHFDTNKFYIQVGAHWVFRIGTLSLAIRGIRLDYSNGSANGSLDEEALRDLFQGGIQDNDPFSFFENTFRYQIGIKQVRIYTGVTTKHQKDNIRPNSDKRIIITAGLICELDEIFNKKMKDAKVIKEMD